MSVLEDVEDDEIDETEDYYALDERQAILSSNEKDPDTSDSEMSDDSDGEDLADTDDEELDVSDKGKSSMREEDTREEAE